MTDEQINAAIAEACGWQEVRVNGNAGVYKGFDNGAELRPDIPDYCTDLNAMHEAEKVLCQHMHASDSDRIVGDRMHAYAELIGYAIDATARQRAEAFLRTLGKWSATDKESLTVGATNKESLQSTSSGGSGGASTYGGKGGKELGIAGAAWPPETRITVNGKTFCLADIDKEMTE